MPDFSKPPIMRYRGPMVDGHVHIRPPEAMRVFLEVAEAYGVRHFVGVGDLAAIAACRKGLPGCVAGVMRMTFEDVADAARFKTRVLTELKRGLDEEDVRGVKFWFSPQFHATTGLWLDDARLDPIFDFLCAQRLPALVHVGDPDAWFAHQYADTAKLGTKAENLAQLERRLARHPELIVQAAHLAGNPERLDQVAQLLETHSNVFPDLSATKWLARELSRKPEESRAFVIRWADRLIWGTDLVVARRPDMTADDYATRYYVHRHLWEGQGRLASPIPDPDADAFQVGPSSAPAPGGGTPHGGHGVMVAGLNLPVEVLRKIYCLNSQRLYRIAVE